MSRLAPVSASLVLLALAVGEVGAEGRPVPVEVVFAPQATESADGVVSITGEVLVSEGRDLAGELVIRLEAESPPAWARRAVPARRLCLLEGESGWTVVDDLGAVAVADASAAVPPEAPSVEDLAERGAELALTGTVDGDRPGVVPVPVPVLDPERQAAIRALAPDLAADASVAVTTARCTVLDAGATLLVRYEGDLQPGGADHEHGQLVMVVACDGRFAVLDGLSADPGREFRLEQEVARDDAD